MNTCTMSQSSASDRLCVGKHLESMPKVAQALSFGEIGYQSASVICHLRDRLGQQRDELDEEQWIRYAREHSIKNMNALSDHMRYVLDPDGFDRDTEQNYEERFLDVSEMNGMYHLTGVIDPEGGAVLKSAVDALADVKAAAGRRLDRDRLPRGGGGHPASSQRGAAAHHSYYHAGRLER